MSYEPEIMMNAQDLRDEKDVLEQLSYSKTLRTDKQAYVKFLLQVINDDNYIRYKGTEFYFIQPELSSFNLGVRKFLTDELNIEIGFR